MSGQQNKYEMSAGKKIARSPYVMQVVHLIYEGKTDVEVRRILKEKFDFEVSIPSIMYFRRNYYQAKLEEAKDWASQFRRSQTSQIQTFIDESLIQATKIKHHIQELERDLARVRSKSEFASKYEPFIQEAFQAVVKRYAEGDTTPFGKGPEEQKLQNLKDAMGESWQAFAAYISTYAAESIHMVKLTCLLEDRIRQQREAVVKIYQDIFKSYKALSMLQELTLIFERYNGIIIEEFFPDKNTMDKRKYKQVRAKILSLYEEFKLRYQGIDIKTDDTRPIEIKAKAENVVMEERVESGDLDVADSPVKSGNAQ